MKYLFVILLFLPLTLVAQKSEVFRIDSLPTEGVQLDKGWKWHAGDNLEWAKADFDDSNWESINPTLILLKLPQIREAEIGWFRIPIEVDSLWINKPLITTLRVCGAAEVYFNGQLLQKIGIVSKDPHVEIAYYTNFTSPANISFPQKDKNVIAVRFSFTKSNIYWASFFFTKRPPFELSIRQLEGYSEMQLDNFDSALVFTIFMLGIFSLLAFIHLAFYYFLPVQKANLLFAYSLLFHVAFFILKYLEVSKMTISEFTMYSFLRRPALMGNSIFLILAAFSYLKQPIKKSFWLIPAMILLSFVLCFTDYKWSRTVFLLTIPAVLFYYLLVVKKSVVEGNKEGKILYYAAIFCILGTITYALPDFLNIFDIRFRWSGLFQTICISVNYLSSMLSMSITLARDFALTSHLLDNKSKEVQQLSTEKHRIATDMHDDIGSDLSALNMKAERIRQKVNQGNKPTAELDNLVESSHDIAKKVREVIWTINARHDTLSSIIHYFDTYAEDLFEPTDMLVRTSIPSNLPDVLINGDSRKVLLMCFKETLNNAYKHAHATEIHIAFTTDNHLLTITIADNGVGFDPSVLTASTTNGNGLVNLQERMKGIYGQCIIQTSPQGTQVVLSLPIGLNSKIN